MRWQKKLNKTDLKHLREVNTNTLTGIKRNLTFQTKFNYVCFECKHIAVKLGLDKQEVKK